MLSTVGSCVIDYGRLRYRLWGNVLSTVGECVIDCGRLCYRLWATVLSTVGQTTHSHKAHNMTSSAILAHLSRFPLIYALYRFLRLGGVPRFYKLAVFSIFPRFYKFAVFSIPAILQTRRLIHFPHFYNLIVFAFFRVSTNSLFCSIFPRFNKLAVFWALRCATCVSRLA